MSTEDGLTRNDHSHAGTPWLGALGAKYTEHTRCVRLADGGIVEVQLSRDNEPGLRCWYDRDEMRAKGLREGAASTVRP
jgi:hypothetical protein